jgi:hypothetical protein
MTLSPFHVGSQQIDGRGAETPMNGSATVVEFPGKPEGLHYDSPLADSAQSSGHVEENESS